MVRLILPDVMSKGSHPVRKAAYFWTFSKGGVKPESKSFGVVFVGPSFGHYGGKRGGLNLFQKFWGSF